MPRARTKPGLMIADQNGSHNRGRHIHVVCAQTMPTDTYTHDTEMLCKSALMAKLINRPGTYRSATRPVCVCLLAKLAEETTQFSSIFII